MNKTSRRWMFFIAALLILSLAATYVVKTTIQESKIAQIYVGGELVETIDLAKVTTPYTFAINAGDGGYNTIAVRPNAIEIIEANCPDQICVHQGAISDGIEPIVCLPHKLVIRIAGEPDIFIPVTTGHDHDHDHDEDQERSDGHDEKADIVSK